MKDATVGPSAIKLRTTMFEDEKIIEREKDRVQEPERPCRPKVTSPRQGEQEGPLGREHQQGEGGDRGQDREGD